MAPSLLCILASFILLSSCQASIDIPGLHSRTKYSYTRLGDVNIGNLVSVHQMNSEGLCTIAKPTRMTAYMAMAYAIDEVNRRQDLLPNITIGFIQLDDCNNDLKALEVCVSLVVNENSYEGLSGQGQCELSTGNTSSGSGKKRPLSVIGIIGPTNSVMSVTVSKFFGTFQLPVMATYATANELNDKTEYPYFMRLVPSDTGEERALIEVAPDLIPLLSMFIFTTAALCFADLDQSEIEPSHKAAL